MNAEPPGSSRRDARLFAAAVTLLAAVTACSNGDSGDDSTPVVDESSPTTEVVVESAPVTEPSTLATTSTTEPAPTTTVLMSEEAAGAAAVALFDEWTACLAALPDCDPVAVSSASTTGAFRDSRYASALEFSSAGYTVENLETLRIVVESATVDEVNGLARVVTCAEDGSTAFGPDGEVVDDDFLSYRWEWELVASGTRWIGANRTELDRAVGEGNSLCR